jgi:hypothetical protein
VRRLLAFSCSTRLGKGCACVLLLIVPGSFLALPLLWIVRRLRLASGG